MTSRQRSSGGAFRNGVLTLRGLVVNREVTSTSTADADIFSVDYLGARAFWANEKGLPRATNTGSDESLLKLLMRSAGQAWALEVTEQATGRISAAIGRRGLALFGEDAFARPVGAVVRGAWANAAGSTTVDQTALNLTLVGTATAATQNFSTLYGSIPRLEYLVTTAATTAVATIRTNSNFCGRVNSGIFGGFRYRARAGPATGVATTSSRFFMGLRVSAATTDVEPSSLTNMVGVGYDSADTNLQLMTNGASGTATKIDLGASFPVPTTDRAAMYEIGLDTRPGESVIRYAVRDVISGATVFGSTSTNLPALGTGLAPLIQMSAGGTSSVVGLAFVDLEVMTYEPYVF